MTTPLRVLMVEDHEDDADLILAELRRGGYEPDFRRVESAEDLEAALGNGDWDVVLCDYNLPQFDAPHALQMVKRRGVDLPFIILSGVVREDAVVAVMRAGAHDFFKKDNLTLLPAAVRRELREANVRRQRRRAIEMLREEETRYRALFEQSPDGVMLVNPETTQPVDFNDAMCRMLGYTREEYRQLHVADFEALESAAQVREHFDRILLEGREDFETRHRTKDGDLRDIAVTVQTIVLGGRRLVHAICRDITVQKQALDALRQSEHRYRQLLEAVTSYTYTVHFENGAPISTTHSPGCVQTTGYSPEDYERNPTLWIEMVPIEDRGKVLDYASQVLAGERVPPLEHRIVRSDGAVRWVRNTIVQHCDNEHLVRYDGLVEDITERWEAERSLHAREAQLEAFRRMQDRLAASAPPQLPGFDIAGACTPAEFAGGDYFDFLKVRDGTLLMAIGDASGHWIDAALVMAAARAYLRGLVQAHTSPAEILGLMNNVLVEEVEEGFFVTLLLVRLNPRTGTLTYSSAGHSTAYVLDAAGGVKARVESTGMPLGFLPNVDFTPGGPIELAPGDVVLLVTDGVFEAGDAPRRMFEMQRALDVVRENRHRSAARIVEALQQAVRDFCLPNRPGDDVTCIVLKAEGSQSQP